MGEDAPTVFTLATNNSRRTYVAGSGNYRFNPTIIIPEGYFDDFSEYTGSNYYYEKYNELLTKEYVESMNTNSSVKTELNKLINAIEYTKSEEYAANKFYTYENIIEPSFTENHSVSNCEGILSVYDAICDLQLC